MKAFKLALIAIVSLGVFAPSLYAASEGVTTVPSAAERQSKAKVAGFVIAARGSLTATDNTGNTRELTRRSQFYANETLKTGDGSLAQIRFQDRALMTLKANSQLNIGEYHFGGEKDPENKSFLELVSGGFRTISGAIGKTDKSAYRIQTPAASIGIRGTDYELIISLDGKVFAAVHDGGITLTNDLGDLNLGSDSEYLFAEVGAGQSPLGLTEMPEVFNVKDGEKEELTEEQKAKLAKKIEEGQNKLEALLAGLGAEKVEGDKLDTILEEAVLKSDVDTRLPSELLEKLQKGDFTILANDNAFVTGSSIENDGKRIVLTENNALRAFKPASFQVEDVGGQKVGSGHDNILWGTWNKGVSIGDFGVESPLNLDGDQYFLAVRQMDAESIRDASGTTSIPLHAFTGTTSLDKIDFTSASGNMMLDFNNKKIDGNIYMIVSDGQETGLATLSIDGSMLANNQVNNTYKGTISAGESSLSANVYGAIAQPTNPDDIDTAGFAGGFDASLPLEVTGGFKVGAKGMFVFANGTQAKIIPMAPPK